MAQEGKETPSVSGISDVTEERVLAVVAETGARGCHDDHIQNSFPSLNIEQRILIMNSLIAKRLIDVYEGAGGGLLYKRRAEGGETPAGLRGADLEEKVVYEIIREAGSRGIWLRDIRFQSKLHEPTLKKSIKALENRKMIKAVKSISGTRKVVYMVWGLEPDTSVTGGAWYTDQDFESEFVDVLNQQCFRFLSELRERHDCSAESLAKGPLALYNITSASPAQVCKYITHLGISKVPLSEDDIQAILDTLVYDGKVVREARGGDVSYRAVSRGTGPAGLSVTPCGVCPVMANCRPDLGAPVCPHSCMYLTTWAGLPVIKTDPVREQF